MARKAYRWADLAPDQFFFQAAGDELSALVGQHRAEIDGLAIGLDDDAGISMRAAVAIAPTFILDANVFDFRCAEPLAKPAGTDTCEDDTLISLNLQFRLASKAAQKSAEHSQANRNERRIDDLPLIFNRLALIEAIGADAWRPTKTYSTWPS